MAAKKLTEAQKNFPVNLKDIIENPDKYNGETEPFVDISEAVVHEDDEIKRRAKQTYNERAEQITEELENTQPETIPTEYEPVANNVQELSTLATQSQLPGSQVTNFAIDQAKRKVFNTINSNPQVKKLKNKLKGKVGKWVAKTGLGKGAVGNAFGKLFNATVGKYLNLVSNIKALFTRGKNKVQAALGIGMTIAGISTGGTFGAALAAVGGALTAAASFGWAVVSFAAILAAIATLFVTLALIIIGSIVLALALVTTFTLLTIFIMNNSAYIVPEADPLPALDIPASDINPGDIQYSQRCISLDGTWAAAPNYATNVQTAIRAVLSSDINNKICGSGENITLKWDIEGTVLYGGVIRSYDPNIIAIGTDGASNSRSAKYTLAHELSHILDSNYSQIRINYANSGAFSEGYLPSYPGAFSIFEDRAESLGLWLFLPEQAIYSGISSYELEYPLHYEFANEFFTN